MDREDPVPAARRRSRPNDPAPRKESLRVRVIHWGGNEAIEGIERIRRLGHAVFGGMVDGPALVAELEREPPDVIVVDLGKRPATGRDAALALRKRRGTRAVPLVLAGGVPDAIRAAAALLPGVVTAPWERIERALLRAEEGRNGAPRPAPSVFAGYSGTPLPRKLGIREGSVVALVGAPEGFARSLVPLPAGVRLVGEPTAEAGLVVWFVRSREALAARIGEMAEAASRGKVWIVWPKRSSPLAADLGQDDVRRSGLAAGMVDFKVCAVDVDWSGLLFTKRR